MHRLDCVNMKGGNTLSNPRLGVTLFRTGCGCHMLPIMQRAYRVTSMKYNMFDRHLGLYSLSGQTSYRKISWRLDARKLVVIMVVSRWKLTGNSAGLLLRCLPIPKRLDKSNHDSRGFETLRYIAVRRPSAWWVKALGWFVIILVIYRHTGGLVIILWSLKLLISVTCTTRIWIRIIST